MAITSSSNPAFIEATQYSTFILQNLHDGLLPNTFYRNVTDFPNGSTLNIKTIGSATIQEITEDEDITYNPIESGNIQLSISDYIGDGFYVTDIMRQDGAQVEQLLSMRASEGTRAIQETFESRFLDTLYKSQTDGQLNDTNGFAHRLVGSAGAGNEVMTEDELIEMRLAFDKANVPMNGRIALVDPVVAATFSKTVTLTSQVGIGASGPLFQQLVKDGFDKDHKFVTELHGWQIWTSNRLPQVAAGAGNGVVTTDFASVANIFMCVADDQCKPGMVAWRQTPTTETDRDISKGRDEFVTKTRWGDGVQRVDTLGVVLTNATATA
ncbi:hypothetical protein OAP25_00985 [Flavobacteriaceae bacterium]|nr:hypothetical protein [Flavobacteriaceae bacterium]